MKYSLLFAASALVASRLAPPLDAQQPDTARIAPVVVTATRVPISAAAQPATVDVITGEELRLRGVTSVADALQSLPGVTFAQSGSFGATTSLFLRGGESKYVKVLVDGVPVNDPGGSIDFSTLTTDNVDRIEIVRGPASVLYGADAVTGVIQIFTRRGSGAPHTIISARGGNYASSDVDGSVLGAFSNGDFSLALARHDTKGVYAFNNAFRTTVASGGVHLSLDPRTNLRLDFRYNDDAYHYPTDGGGDVVDSNAMQSLDRTLLTAELTRLLTSRIDAHLTLTSEETSGGTDDQPDTPSSSGFESVDRTRRRGVDLRGNFDLPIATILTVGGQAEQEDERTESQSVFGTFNSTSVFSAARRNTALYGQTLTTLADSVVVTLGGRRDDNERFGVFGTYRIGASWRARTGTQLRASAGTAFREPTFLENYSTGFVTGNRSLRPERTGTWEVGLRQWLLHDRVSLGVTHFDQRFRDMIDYTGSTNACGASYCNVARALSRGQEFEAHVTATRHIGLDANLTHLDTRVLTPGDTANGSLYVANQALIRRPTTSWNVGGSFASVNGSFDVRVTHVGERTDRDFRPYPALAVIDPAYTRTDLGAALPLARFSRALNGAELTLHVENLFDAKYESVFNFESPGRTAMVGGRVSF